MILPLGDGCDYISGGIISIDDGHHLAARLTFAGLNPLGDDAWRKIREASTAATAASRIPRST